VGSLVVLWAAQEESLVPVDFADWLQLRAYLRGGPCDIYREGNNRIVLLRRYLRLSQLPCLIQKQRVLYSFLSPESLAAAHLAHEVLLHFTAVEAHGLEHLAHLQVLAEEVVGFLHRGAGA
jgi:hypothetical protein